MNVGNYLSAICVIIIFLLAVYELYLGIMQAIANHVRWYRQGDVAYGVVLLLLMGIFILLRMTNHQLSGLLGIIIPIIFLVFTLILVSLVIWRRRKNQQSPPEP